MATKTKPVEAQQQPLIAVQPVLKETTEVATKNDTPNINDIDLKNIDLAALKSLMDKTAATFKERQQGELKTLVNGWLLKAEAVGFTKDDVILEIESRFPASAERFKQSGEVKTRAPRGSVGPREYKDKDSSGARPAVGSTYSLNGLDWEKKTKLGATKKEFVAAVTTGGKLWADLLKK